MHGPSYVLIYLQRILQNARKKKNKKIRKKLYNNYVWI